MSGAPGRGAPTPSSSALGGLGRRTAWQLARRGCDVVCSRSSSFGHTRGASHDTSRILRRSYHTPAYVRLANEAYDDWARLEQASGETLVTTTGGLDLFPPGAAIPLADYTTSLRVEQVPFELLTAAEITQRWPAMAVPEGTTAAAPGRDVDRPGRTQPRRRCSGSRGRTAPGCTTARR